jgi:hypothetical protein
MKRRIASMKKNLLISAALIMCLMFTSCGAGNVGVSSSPKKASSSVSSEVSDKSFGDSLDGLKAYMKKAAGFSGTPTNMRADFIGAEKGIKYIFSHNGKNNVTVELYSFDTSNLSDSAEKVIDSVKSDGYFTIMDKNINAVMSDSGKYMMIYTNSSTDDDNKAYDKNVLKLFKGFKA